VLAARDQAPHFAVDASLHAGRVAAEGDVGAGAAGVFVAAVVAAVVGAVAVEAAVAVDTAVVPHSYVVVAEIGRPSVQGHIASASIAAADVVAAAAVAAAEAAAVVK